MLIVQYRGDSDEKEFHLSESIPPRMADRVLRLQADGDELEAIRRLFPALTPEKRVVIWYGDIAKTILANLW